MEPAGLALSIGSLLGVIDSCFNLYADIRKSSDRDGDIHASSIRLGLEKLRLNAFQEYASSSQGLDALNAPVLGDMCAKVVKQMGKDLTAIQSILRLHENHVVGNAEKGQKMKEVAGRASARIRKTWHSTTWAAYDKTRLQELITGLKDYNDWLMTLVPPARRQRTAFEATSSAIYSNRPSTLEDVQEATSSVSPVVSCGAEIKKMTIIAQGSFERLEQSVLAPEEYRIPIADFSRLTQGHTSQAELTVEEASSGEKAVGILRNNQISNTRVAAYPVAAQPVIVEWRESFRSEDNHSQFAHRLNCIVAVLRKLSASVSQSFLATNTDGDFDILHCLGWTTTSEQFDRIGLVFGFPSNLPSQPIPRPLSCVPDIVSLNEWMVYTRRNKSIDPPALGLRFDIARGLVLALGNLISVGWVHKELRSHNVLFIGRLGSGSCLSKPYLTGYTYARPTKDTIRDVSNLSTSPEYALYRPPMETLIKQQTRIAQAVEDSATQDEQSQSSSDDSDSEIFKSKTRHTNTEHSSTSLTSALDIYGLGIILLEIGLWRTIANLQSKSESRDAFIKYELDELVKSLSYRMGDLYCNVVKLSLRLGDWAQTRAQETEFFGRAIEDLALCRA